MKTIITTDTTELPLTTLVLNGNMVVSKDPEEIKKLVENGDEKGIIPSPKCIEYLVGEKSVVSFFMYETPNSTRLRVDLTWEQYNLLGRPDVLVHKTDVTARDGPDAVGREARSLKEPQLYQKNGASIEKYEEAFSVIR